MKKWFKLLIISVVIIIVFIVGINLIYYIKTGGVDCCSCCGDNVEVCISTCCDCNYNTIEKMIYILK